MSKVQIDREERAAAERRRSERTDLVVQVNYATVDEIFSDFTRDINEGGIFIETDKPCPTGTEVSMVFNLPGTNETFETVGCVVRISPGDQNNPPGMGIEFDELDAEARHRINGLVRSLRIAGPRSES